MTTKDIIKMLPLDAALKMEILNKFDFMDATQKFTLERLAWKTYDMIYQENIDKNLELQYAKVLKGEEKGGNDFYERVLKKTDQQMTETFQGSAEKIDLSAARKAMEVIVREIQATKNSQVKRHAD